ncbi:2-dehydropantoate 2-reductase [Clostridium sp. MCC353]|uniref:ketopantoate reductase family protein n=1 Tax=Clostridium sp. MCC353 TaxID=2592646 RepID=UPI001C033BD6|nr:ketopantoate reductase family protein [Clostridium sp. MCC353]MBT9779510.1 2-dehydropantoate 2-reductase [Clostridium sp. MCC353]
MRTIKTAALIGLGAIGSYLAGNLSKVMGDDLRIIAGGSRKERIERDGIVINGEPYHFHVVSPEEETGYADLAIVITKFTGIREALKDMKNQIGPDTVIMAPLNGVESEEAAAEEYGWDRVIYSLARVSVVMKGNQVSYNPKVAHMEFGEKTNQTISERVQAVKDLFESAGIESWIPEDMERAIWMKYMCNVSENQTAAVLGIPFGAWSGVSDHATAVREMVMREVVAVAQKKGIDLSEEDIRKQKEVLKKMPYQNKPSTLQDIESGRKTEVDMFAGTMVRLGKELGVPTPLNSFLYHAIHVLEEKNEGII